MQQSNAVPTHHVITRVLGALAGICGVIALGILFIPTSSGAYDCGGVLTNKWMDYASDDNPVWRTCRNAQDTGGNLFFVVIGLAVVLLVVRFVVRRSYLKPSPVAVASTSSSRPSAAQAAGWYPNPNGEGQLFWDGKQWFDPSKPPGTPTS